MNLEERINKAIREIKDFPKQGINFKDITPLLKDPKLTTDIVDALAERASECKPDAMVAIESRGFWFGLLMAQKLQIPFVPIRKLGKLPYDTFSFTYELEYGKATMEIHKDGLKKGQRVIIHDDILATGGTAIAAAELVKMEKAEVCGYIFVLELDFLNGKDKLLKYSPFVHSLLHY